ncbi:MAG: type II secretion system F family protein [Nanoarchaeota archaeon]
MFKAKYLAGIIAALIAFAADYYLLFGTRWFYPGIVVCLIIALAWQWIDFINETKRQKEIEIAFLEFSRNLVESVKSGIAIPRAVMYVSNKEYRSLTPYVKKLAGQIELGIPVRKALWTFANDTKNPVIKRSISIMNEAERSGGDIRDVLDSIVSSVLNVKKLKEERRASVYSQVVQGYLVFFIFIAIMLVLELWLFPKLGGLSGGLETGISGANLQASTIDIDKIFFSLIIIQGFFAGIMIGKFSEGTLKQGLIHSFILMMLAALIVTTAKGGI